MAFTANRYLATFNEGAGTETQTVEVFAADDTDAQKKVTILFPNATSIVVSTPSS
tara:strand:+ start:2173 stop:2337 length:165 start_codon:yes stop_codon:yes gene_type:complete